MAQLFFFLNFGFIYLWLCWVFISVRGLSPAVASGGHSSSRCAGPSPSRPLLLRSTGSRRAGSVVVAHRPSCSAACGILPDRGSNPCPLHWQADSQPLCHQGSPSRPLSVDYMLSHAVCVLSYIMLTSTLWDSISTIQMRNWILEGSNNCNSKAHEIPTLTYCLLCD